MSSIMSYKNCGPDWGWNDLFYSNVERPAILLLVFIGFGKKALFAVNGYKILYFVALENLEGKEKFLYWTLDLGIFSKLLLMLTLPLKSWSFFSWFGICRH